jgi:hypothetical protein
MGIRTLIDMVLQEAVGDKGNFQATLIAAVDGGYMTSHEKKALEAAIDAGSAAAHRGFRPNEQQLNDALGITEHLLEGRYIWGPRSSKLHSQIPPRP